MAEKYKHYYVSQSLVKNWSKDGKHVAWFDPIKKKSIPNGGKGRYFHSNLIDIEQEMKEMLEKIDEYFESIVQVFLNGEVDCLKAHTPISSREILMFQLLQAPQAFFSEEKMITMIKSSLGFSFYDSRKEAEEEARTENITTALSDMMTFGVDILDMEAVILDAPEGSSFLLGSFPFALLNPYFASAHPPKDPALPAFDFWGAIIVLPLSPKMAICLYDPDTYTLLAEDGKAVLTEEDMNVLNSAALYNSGENGGVIHISGEEYINKLYYSLPNDDFYRDIYLGDTLDEYPFPTNLSILKVKEEAEKELKKREQGLLRPFVSAIFDYDNNHPDKKKRKDFKKVCSKRFNEAEKILAQLRGSSKKSD